jgi:hypothetical protein
MQACGLHHVQEGPWRVSCAGHGRTAEAVQEEGKTEEGTPWRSIAKQLIFCPTILLHWSFEQI